MIIMQINDCLAVNHFELNYIHVNIKVLNEYIVERLIAQPFLADSGCT